MRHVLNLLVLWVCMGLGIHAQARPIEVKSENFVFVGNVAESSARELLTELEIYRAAILHRMGAKIGPELIPVRIYSASGPKGIATLTGVKGADGVYLSTVEGPVFVLNSAGGFRRGKKARAIALHEYTHHLLASFTGELYPRWFDEGLAEYLSTFELDRDGNMVIGAPDQDHAFMLSQKNWFPFRLMLAGVRAYPFSFTDNSRNGQYTRGMYYAQSWLAVHFIQSTKGYNAKLDDYVARLNARQSPLKAFEKAFGMKPAEFEALLRAYRKRNRFLKATFKNPTKSKDIKLAVREMGKGELYMHKAEAIRAYQGTKERYKKALEYYDRAAKELGNSPRIQAGRAAIAAKTKDYDKALGLVTAALKQTPDDEYLNRVAGMVLMMKNDTDKKPDMAEIKRARKHLKKAMMANPDNAAAHYYYVQTFIIAHDPPTRQAIASAVFGLDYYRSINFVDTNVDFAEILINTGRKQLARKTLERAIAWSNNSDVQYYARDVLSSMH